jgi:N6-adenosine-specific RNA methylase IME4
MEWGEMIEAWPFDDVPLFRHRLIYADPPWSYEMYSEKGYEKSPEAQYDTMSDEDIFRLPVGHLAHGDGALLVLWYTWPKAPVALECLKRWGFNYITGGSWIKTSKDGTKLRIGTGYNFRSACEPFLLARIGPSQARVFDIPNVIIEPSRQHSRKPDQMRVICERLCPEGPRIELFARELWPGNDVWGNETQKFAEGAAA